MDKKNYQDKYSHRSSTGGYQECSGGYQERSGGYQEHSGDYQERSSSGNSQDQDNSWENELKPYEAEKDTDSNKEEITPIFDFEDMNLNESLFRGIISYGFEKPTFVQAHGIPLFKKNRDMIIQSQSGTGKTATFLIGAINNIDENENGCQVLIISHTRELAKQTYNTALNLSSYTKIKIVLCTKENVRVSHNQIRSTLNNNPCMVVATPGKLCYFLKEGIISTYKLKILIIDEADELLSIGFINAIKEIYGMTPELCNIYLFSATMSEAFIKTTKKFMKNPIMHILKPDELTLDGIKQYYCWLKNNDSKFYYLLDIYDKLSISQSIIYVNSANMAKELSYRLNKEKFTTSIIYGALSVEDRNSVMKNFRSGASRILISTDLLARGIDIQQIAVVINYELPFDRQLDSYIHRIGRSGRFGRKGAAINFVTDRDVYKIEKIEKFYKTNIDKMPDNIEDIL